MPHLLASYHFTKNFQQVSFQSMNEDQLIRWLSHKTKKHIGDDAAVLKPTRGKRLVVCSDSLVEGIHFNLASISAKDLGWKSLAVNLSDLASMGATPKASLLNLSLPKKYMSKWVSEFLKGYLSLSEKHKVSLVGGDTTASPKLVFISVTAFGEIQKKNIKFRSTARPGDFICVTGPLGDSKAGLHLQSHLWKSTYGRQLLRRHHQPVARVEMGEWLGRQSKVTSMMDLSDGLLKDLNRLCQASGVSALLDHRTIPQSRSLLEFAKKFNKSPVKEAIVGGEDYELLFTCEPKQKNRLLADFKRNFKKEFHIIGEIEELRSTNRARLKWKDVKFAREVSSLLSFEHF